MLKPYNKPYNLNLVNLFSFAFLLLLIVVIPACKKELIIGKEENDRALVRIKKDFYNNHFDTVLVAGYDIERDIKWVIEWEKVSIKSLDGTNYYYFPMTPTVVSRTDGVESLNVEFVGTKKYLIATIDQTNTNIMQGTYVNDDEWIQENVNEDGFFSNFTGTAILQKLSSKEIFYIKYFGGERVSKRNYSKNGATISAIVKECQTYFECEWTTNCGATIYFRTTYTPGCSEPTYTPDCISWSYIWNLRRTSSYEVCQWISYPDAPPLPGQPSQGTPITINSIVKAGTTLGNSTKLLLEKALEDCFGRTIISNLASSNKKLTFKEDANFNGVALYTPNNETVTIKPTDARIYAMMEELLHAYQDTQYPGGTTQYTGESPVPGAQNLEFEAKLLLDIRAIINTKDPAQKTNYGKFVMGIDMVYMDWLEEITDGGSKAPDNFELFRTKYFEYLNLFGPRNPKYAHLLKDDNLDPGILTKAFQGSNCL